jgi:prepilin-type N-terminal cleavage/methylation domain-containing protein
MARHANAVRCGFTVIEMMIVIAIMVILIGLTLCAVQHAREAASSAVCKNNLKQIALGFHNHHSAFRVFPSNGGGAVKPLPAADGGTFMPTSTYTEGSQIVTYFWSVGAPGLRPAE